MVYRGPVESMSLRKEGSQGSLWRSFAFAWKGIRHALRTQRNLRIHLAVTVVVLLAGVLLGLNGLELSIVALTSAFVLFAEMINTVVEAVVDLVTLDHDHRAEIAKDVAAGAVLLAAALSVLVGILVFGPHLLRLF